MQHLRFSKQAFQDHHRSASPGPCVVRVGRTLANSGPMFADFGPTPLADLESMLVESRPTLADFPANAALKCGQKPPGQLRAGSGPMLWSMLANVCPTLVEVEPKLIDVLPNLVDPGLISTESGPHLCNSAHLWSMPGNIGPFCCSKLSRIWPKLGQTRRACQSCRSRPGPRWVDMNPKLVDPSTPACCRSQPWCRRFQPKPARCQHQTDPDL